MIPAPRSAAGRPYARSSWSGTVKSSERLAQDEPVRDAVPVGVFPHAEHPSIPSGNERRHEGGKRQRAPHDQILDGTSARHPEEPHAYIEEKSRIGSDESEIDRVERYGQKSAFKPTKIFRVAAGMK